MDDTQFRPTDDRPPNGTASDSTWDRADDGLRQALAYLTGEMSAEQRHAYEAKIADDAAWREELADVRTVLAAIDAATVEHTPSRDLWPLVRARLIDDLGFAEAVRVGCEETAPIGADKSTPTDADSTAVRERTAHWQQSVDVLFAVTAATPMIEPPSDLFAKIKAGIRSTTTTTTTTSVTAVDGAGAEMLGSAGGRVVMMQNHHRRSDQPLNGRGWRWGMGLGAAAAVMIAVSLSVKWALDATIPVGAPPPSAVDGPPKYPHPPDNHPHLPDRPDERPLPDRRGPDSPEHVETPPDRPPVEQQPETPDFTELPDEFDTHPPIDLPVSRHRPTVQRRMVARGEVQFFATPPFELATPMQVVLGAGDLVGQLNLPTVDGMPVVLERGMALDELRVVAGHSTANAMGTNVGTTIHGEGTVRVYLSLAGEPGFSPFGLPYDIFFQFDNRRHTWSARSASAMVVRSPLLKTEIFLVDANLNGRFNDIGIDRVAVAGDPRGMVLHHALRLDGQILEARITDRGTVAAFTPYNGPTGQLVISTQFRDGVAVEHVRLRSEICELVVTAAELGQELSVPTGRYALVTGRVTDGVETLSLENVGPPPLGLAEQRTAMGDSAVVVPDVAVEVETEDRATLIFGAPLRLVAELPSLTGGLLGLSAAQVLLVGASGERYTGTLDGHGFAPSTADLIEFDRVSWRVAMPGRFRYSETFGRMFLAVQYDQRWHPRGPLALRVVDRDFATFLTNRPAVAIFLLR